MGLDTKEASRTSQLGQSLPDHSGSSALRGDSSSGGAGAPAGSRTKHQTSACSATVTDDVEAFAGHLGSSKKPAWNKGLTMSAEMRKKISLAQKRRWKDPNLRATVAAKMAGKVPWNKGRKMSDETRAKMSAARQNKPHLKSTRKKMSQSHIGMTHTPETVAAFSAKLRGRVKDEDHRQAIAASQRRRHAACRVLSAIEQVHASAGGSGKVPLFDPSRFRNPDSAGSSSGLKGLKSSRPQNKAQILATYRAALREYRALQEELTPWTQAFEERHGRKPRLVDVERTGVEWLIAKYKCYVMMRERLVMDTPQLRTKLSSAKPGSSEAFTSLDETAAGSWSTPAASGPGAGGAARYAAALQHKRAQAARATPPSDLAALAGGAAAAASSAAEGGAEPAADGTAADSPSPAAAVPLPVPAGVSPASGSGRGALPWAGSPPGSSARAPPNRTARSGAAGGAADTAPRALPAAPPHAPQRVRSAMAAALQYRQKKAADTAAAASAAGREAAVPPSDRPRPPAAPPATKSSDDQADE